MAFLLKKKCEQLLHHIFAAKISMHLEIAITVNEFVNDELVKLTMHCLFVCVEVLRPSQPNGVMSSAVSLPNHTFTGQA